MNHIGKTTVCFILAVFLAVSAANAQDIARITLPAPQTDIGLPIMQVLNLRQSIREYDADRDIPPQELSNLLWAAWGVNRPDGRRTAPSAVNYQETDVYVICAQGVYRFDAAAHTLEPVAAGDHRAEVSDREFVFTAPLILVYVTDFTRMRGGRNDGNMVLAHADAGFISQNVYLYCASQGLGTVVMGAIDRDAYGKVLNIGPDQFITYAQPVGYQR